MTSGIKEPDVNMDTDQVIKYHGYPCETHQVITSDGYILKLHRIPHGISDRQRRRPVVFLQHGILDTSFTWVSNGPGKSLGFILADLGYDVWLGNSRGNIYSRYHEHISPASNAFWDFTWDEMAAYDLPAAIELALYTSRAAKLSFIAHSEGTQIGFAQFSKRTDLNKKISSFVALAPAAYLGHVRSPVRLLTHIAGIANVALQIFTSGQFLPNTQLFSILEKAVCSNTPGALLCGNIGFFFIGVSDNNLNHSRIPVYVSHIPGGTSMKNMLHYAQSVLSNRFQYFDHGIFGNMRHYKQSAPRQYRLNTHGIPVAAFYGGNDPLVTPIDAERTLDELGRNVKFRKLIPGYNHVDLIWGITATELVFPDLIRFLRKYQ